MKSLSLGGILFSSGLILSVFWGYDFLIFLKGFIVFFLLLVGSILIYFGIEDFSFSIKESRLEESSSEDIQEDIQEDIKEDIKEESNDSKEKDETEDTKSKETTDEDENLEKE